MTNPKSFLTERLVPAIRERWLLALGSLVIVLAIGGYLLGPKIVKFLPKEGSVQGEKTKQVDAPTIVDGELVLPKVYSGGVLDAKSNIHVLSAFLVGVFEEPQQQSPLAALGGGSQEPPKLVGIRILGEMVNVSKVIIKEASPVVRFYDEKDKLIAQKLAKVTPGFNFYSLVPTETGIYDILVEEPPTADKMEILFNAKESEKKASFEKLKIVTSALEVKTAKYQENSADTSNEIGVANESTESGEATPSATPIPTSAPTPVATEVEYYTLTGSFQNNLVDSVTDVSVYAWVKNSEGKVFSFARQDFKGDLISPKKQVDFKINLLPFKYEEKMDKYGLVVFAKRYQLK